MTIASASGDKKTFPCSVGNDQEALIYAGKVVEQNANASDPEASVTIEKDGKAIGPATSVAEMTKKTI